MKLAGAFFCSDSIAMHALSFRFQVDALPGVRKAWSQAIKQIGVGIMANGEDPEEHTLHVAARLPEKPGISSAKTQK